MRRERGKARNRIKKTGAEYGKQILKKRRQIAKV
jgi:hypothetical protein